MRSRLRAHHDLGQASQVEAPVSPFAVMDVVGEDAQRGVPLTVTPGQ